LFFLVVLGILSVNWSGKGDPQVHLDTSIWGRLSPLAGLLLGVLWQVVDRRDLTDRLRVPALVFAGAALLQGILDQTTIRPTGVSLGIGVAAGLILGEAWLRRSAKMTAVGRARRQPPSGATPSSTR
jgi:hypothetical protein